jgi:integrase
MTKNSLREQIIENKPKIGLSTIKTYLSNISTLSQKMSIPLEDKKDFITHKDKIIDFLKNMEKYQHGKTRLSAILAVIKPTDLTKLEELDDETKEAINEYNNLMNEFKKTYNDNMNNQEMTDVQKENFLPWDKIVEIYNKLKQVANPLFKFDPNYIRRDSFETLKHFIVLSLYVLTPPRRALDYTAMKVKNFDYSDGSKDNYILDVKGKWYFVFNNYKNANRLGKQTVEVPKELKAILKNWLRFNKESDYLIPSKTGGRIQDNKINAILNEIFRRNIGVTLLRHAFITNRYGNIDLNKLQEDTEKLGSNNIPNMLRYVDKEKAKE